MHAQGCVQSLERHEKVPISPYLSDIDVLCYQEACSKTETEPIDKGRETYSFKALKEISFQLLAEN